MRLGRLRAFNVPVTSAPNVALALPPRFRLCGWSLLAAGSGDAPSSASTAVAAAAAGTLTLTGFTSVGSVTATPEAAWPAGANVVTVTNVSGGPVTAAIEGGTENPVIITFTPPVGVTGTPVVSVPAIVGGPAYIIDAYGEAGGTGSIGASTVATLTDAGTTVGVSAPIPGESDTQFFDPMGVELTSGLTVTITAGSMSGCVYVREAWPDNLPPEPGYEP